MLLGRDIRLLRAVSDFLRKSWTLLVLAVGIGSGSPVHAASQVVGRAVHNMEVGVDHEFVAGRLSVCSHNSSYPVQPRVGKIVEGVVQRQIEGKTPSDFFTWLHLGEGDPPIHDFAEQAVRERLREAGYSDPEKGLYRFSDIGFTTQEALAFQLFAYEQDADIIVKVPNPQRVAFVDAQDVEVKAPDLHWKAILVGNPKMHAFAGLVADPERPEISEVWRREIQRALPERTHWLLDRYEAAVRAKKEFPLPKTMHLDENGVVRGPENQRYCSDIDVIAVIKDGRLVYSDPDEVHRYFQDLQRYMTITTWGNPERVVSDAWGSSWFNKYRNVKVTDLKRLWVPPPALIFRRKGEPLGFIKDVAELKTYFDDQGIAWPWHPPGLREQDPVPHGVRTNRETRRARRAREREARKNNRHR